jgi:hypothetical protein
LVDDHKKPPGVPGGFAIPRGEWTGIIICPMLFGRYINGEIADLT